VHAHLSIRSAPGEEKFTFLYVVIAAIAITCAIAYSLIANLGPVQSSLLLAGALLVGGAFVFSYMEIRRITRPPASVDTRKLDEDPDPYGPRKLTIAAPTKDAYPHHEDYVESRGLDQSQLTARIPGSTPFLGRFFGEKEEKPKVV